MLFFNFLKWSNSIQYEPPILIFKVLNEIIWGCHYFLVMQTEFSDFKIFIYFNNQCLEMFSLNTQLLVEYFKLKIDELIYFESPPLTDLDLYSLVKDAFNSFARTRSLNQLGKCIKIDHS